MMNKFSNRSLKNLVGVHPDLVRLMKASIIDCPIDFTITEGVRTVLRQRELFAQGRTKPGVIVTQCDGVKKRSNHQPKADGCGYAVDLYAYPIDVNDTVNIQIIADHIKKKAQELNIRIEWGGDWKMKDYPHFELKG